MDLIDPQDSLARQNIKLMRITEALMRRVEQAPDQAGLAYAQFERAALLEEQVRQRTTDLERALDLLHESNARVTRANKEADAARANLTEAVETIDEGFAMFDDDDQLVMFNSRFCLDLPDVRGKLEQGTGFNHYVHLVSESDHLDPADTGSPEAWRAKRLLLHRKDHAVFNIRLVENRWMQVSEHRTETRGTVVLQTDVTQIMRMEKRQRDKLIEQQATMLRATLDHLYQGVCIFNSEGCLVGWNQRMEHLLQRQIDDKFHGSSFRALLNRLDRVLTFSDGVSRQDMQDWAEQRGNQSALNFEVDRNDGAVFDVFAQEMPDAGFVISFSDVTKERRTSQALRELNETLERRVADRTTELGNALEDARRANASKNRFVAAASHDLLQPLSAAKLYAATLEDRVADEDDKVVARKAISALASAEGIIDALMDISKLDLGLAHFEVGPIPLGQVLSALETEFTPIADANGVRLRVVGTSAQVISDRLYLHRTIQNLISNAIRYTTGTEVLVGVRRQNGSVRIDVLDQGPGISTADQTIIFQEFKQLDPARPHHEGLGLGLAIVERACKMLGHQLSLWSEVGVGSCFSVTVGCAGPDHIVAPLTPAPQQISSPAAHVLALVENDLDLANSITLIVEGFGSEVVHAPSGKAALALLDELGIVPDAFLIDYQLGDDMTGVELAQVLRARYDGIPMEVISANRSERLIAQCRALDLPLRRKPLTRDGLHEFLCSLPKHTP